MKKSAIAVAGVLCTLMLIATVFTISVNAGNAATTDVFLTVEQTTVTSQYESTIPAVSENSTPDNASKSNDSQSVRTGNTVCIIAGSVMLMSGFLTVWLERKRER